MKDWAGEFRGFGGRIIDFPLTSVLQILELGKKSGFLYVRSFPKVAFLVFRDGGVVQAVSSLRRAGLGELLISEGLIQKDDLSHALDIQRKAPKKIMLGEIFEELGHVQHDQIIHVLTKQMKEIVLWVLAWKDGEFTFYAGPEAKPETVGKDEEMVLPVGILVQEVLQEVISEKDRRRYPRVPISIKVVWKRASGDLTLYTSNVSSGGLYLLSEQFPEKGETLEMELWIPTLIEPAQSQCKVVRVNPEGAGVDAKGFAVEFIRIEDEARGILERLGGALSKIL